MNVQHNHTHSTYLKPLENWQDVASCYQKEVQAWTQPYRKRKTTHKAHPVLDFMFTYYSYSMGRLETWHPGYGHLLSLESDADTPKGLTDKFYGILDQQLYLDPALIDAKRIPRLEWILSLLKAIHQRPASFGCFGLHEWAMVYRGEDIRHRESAPLRLSQAETDQVLENRTVRCSHYDAYRFFSKSALPMNKLSPCMDNRHDTEQPGCLHTNMDLYKWCYKCMPWVSSKLLWKCFKYALKVRELDMRASPYDLSAYDMKPVKIETPSGREEYEKQQRALSKEAEPLRAELICQLEIVIKVAKACV